MKLPVSWLNEYVEVSDIPVEELAEKLTRSGLQVEAIEKCGGARIDDFIVTAEVKTCTPHPDSDHLHVCEVFDGKETFQVVCGAPNCRAGLKTAFAKIGATIPDPEGEFKIKKGKLRGVESFGMLCSARELGLSADHSGIIEFPPETPAGVFVRDAVPGAAPETVFDIEVTWNRPDALSVFGLAREFAAILGRPLKEPDCSITESSVDVNSEVKVSVEDGVRCPRYTARVITSVKDGPSPALMAKRLELCGVRSLGLVVDVTNYVMLELGQPLHAFDYRTLAGRTIVVRGAKEGEKIKTLDGIERALDPSMLLICDAEKASAIAGVMGGEGSEIAPGTDHVLLESALFDPVSTKNTSTALKLATEASYRYIRGVDTDLADKASRRAAHLLQKYGEAVVAKGVVDADFREKPLEKEVPLSFARAASLIGIDIPQDRMVAILESLGLKTVSRTAEGAVFAIPTWRRDLSLEADLVEEIARMNGLDAIPDTMPSAPSVSALSDAPFRARETVRKRCLALGFTEAMHYSFLSAGELDSFDTRNAASRLVLPDPVSAEYAVMRDSLLPQLLGTLGRNHAYLAGGSAALFETGRVFRREADGTPKEEERVALGFAGPAGRGALDSRRPVSPEEAISWMKGAVGNLVAALHAGKLEFRPAEHPAFTPGAALEIVLNNKPEGILGAVSREKRHPFRMNTQMVLAELRLKPLLKRIDAVPRVKPAPVYPAVARDVAVSTAPGTLQADVEKCIRKAAPPELESVRLFDVFERKGAAKGSRSLAYALSFRSPSRTLTDAEVNAAFAKIVEELKTLPGAEVREQQS